MIGVGHLGYHHARHLASMPTVELVGVVDTDLQRCQNVASEFKTMAFTRYEELAPFVEAVIIAVPTSKHYEVAAYFLANKKSVLLEKPIATTLEEADELIRLSEENEVVLQIGHLERFNAAMETLRRRIERPMFIEAHRLSPFTPRGTDVNVVMDLMIHDLDIILSLLGSPVRQILDAVGVPLISESEDIANTRLLFENGCVANITASRVSAEPMRKIRIFQPYTYFSLDYAAQEIKCYRLEHRNSGSTNPRTIVFDEIKVEKDEPLRNELRAFTESVRSNASPVVTGRAGRGALELAIRIVEVIRNRNYE